MKKPKQNHEQSESSGFESQEKRFGKEPEYAKPQRPVSGKKASKSGYAANYKKGSC
jgi:hypothetical protein